tara:strand:+ start:93174 stop:93512 length:339 start_codon:yes stop_codon:yes gene_type:complete
LPCFFILDCPTAGGHQYLASDEAPKFLTFHFYKGVYLGISGSDYYNSESTGYNADSFFNMQIWRVDDVAKFLGCSIGHVYNLASENRIPRRKKGKFLYFVPTEIHEWILEGE